MNATLVFELGDLRVGADEAWADRLVGDRGLPFAAWQRDGLIDCVKSGRHRAVYRLDLPDASFHIKHARATGFIEWSKHLVRPSAARRECAIAQRLIELGVPVPRPVAWQEKRRLGVVAENWLVTETISEACSVRQRMDLLTPAAQDGTRDDLRPLISAVAALVAGLHRHGVVHGDLHPGNILVRDAGPAIEAFLIDLSNVSFARCCDRRSSWANLAMWDAGWRADLTSAERRAFFHEYLDHRPDLAIADPRAALAKLEEASRAYYRRRARRRDRRVWRENRDFAFSRSFRRRVHAVRELAEDERRSLLLAPERLLRTNLHRPVKLDHGAVAVQAQLRLGDRVVPVLYKRYRAKTLGKSVVAGLRAPRAWKAWHAGGALRIRRIETPRPIAACRTGGIWSPARSYLAVEWIEGSRNLHLHAWSLRGRPLSERLRIARACAESLGQVVGRMHSLRISHGDLKAANVLVREESGGVRTWLIDLDDVRIDKPCFERRRRDDLSRLATSVAAHPWVTRAILARFCRAYAAQFAESSVDWKPFWREVLRGRDRRIAEKRARGQEIL